MEVQATERLEPKHPCTSASLLLKLASDEVTLHQRLHALQGELLTALERSMDRPGQALTLAKVIRTVQSTDTAIVGKIRELMTAAETLKLRRRFVDAGGCANDV